MHQTEITEVTDWQRLDDEGSAGQPFPGLLCSLGKVFAGKGLAREDAHSGKCSRCDGKRLAREGARPGRGSRCDGKMLTREGVLSEDVRGAYSGARPRGGARSGAAAGARRGRGAAIGRRPEGRGGGVARQEFPTMPRCSAAADGCCAVALPFAAAAARSAPRGPGSCGAPAAPQRLQPPAGPPLPPPPPPARPRCPAAMNPPAAAGGEETGAAGGGGGCRGAEGGGEAAGAAGIPEEQGLSAADESLEEKLRSLTFRKQVSYRWVPAGRAPLAARGGGGGSGGAALTPLPGRSAAGPA